MPKMDQNKPKKPKKPPKINILTVSVSRLKKEVDGFLRDARRSGKTLSKTHLINYLNLPNDWKQRLRQKSPGPASEKKMDVIIRAFNLIKESLIDALLETPEGRKIVYTTQYSTDDKETGNVIINISKGVDTRGN